MPPPSSVFPAWPRSVGSKIGRTASPSQHHPSRGSPTNIRLEKSPPPALGWFLRLLLTILGRPLPHSDVPYTNDPVTPMRGMSVHPSRARQVHLGEREKGSELEAELMKCPKFCSPNRVVCSGGYYNMSTALSPKEQPHSPPPPHPVHERLDFFQTYYRFSMIIKCYYMMLLIQLRAVLSVHNIQ